MLSRNHSLSIPIYLSIYILSIYLSIYLSVCLFNYIHIHISFSLGRLPVSKAILGSMSLEEQAKIQQLLKDGMTMEEIVKQYKGTAYLNQYNVYGKPAHRQRLPKSAKLMCTIMQYCQVLRVDKCPEKKVCMLIASINVYALYIYLKNFYICTNERIRQ